MSARYWSLRARTSGTSSRSTGARTPTRVCSCPITISASHDIITLKLPNGYNVGIRAEEGIAVRLVSKKAEKTGVKRAIPHDPAKKDVAVISTGGTIASYVDYRTGAVHPAKSAEELVFSVPELMGLCNVRAKVLYSILSENMKVTHWQGLARAVARRAQLRRGRRHRPARHGHARVHISCAVVHAPEPDRAGRVRRFAAVLGQPVIRCDHEPPRRDQAVRRRRPRGGRGR